MQDEADTQSAESSHTIELTSKLDSATAVDLRTEILSHKGHDLTIGADEVDLLGGRCAEVLVAAFSLWQKDGNKIEIQDGSDTFWMDAELLGIAENLRAADT